MTERAPSTVKQVSASPDGLGPSRRVGRRRRGLQEARKECELFDRTDRIKRRRAVGLGNVIRNCRKLACRGFIALGLKQLVVDTHFDVVCLAGEQQERLLLSLPSKPGDRSVLAFS